MRVRASVLALLAQLLASAAHAEEPWKEVLREDGIVVTTREVPGRGFPTFRAVGVIEANLFQILGVLSDVRRHCDWMKRCAAARQLRKINELEYVVYSRIDAPWPTSDRDAVFHSSAHVDVGQRVVDVRFRAVKSPLVPPIEGVVRMTRLQGHYRVKGLSASRSLMDFQVDADPQGLIPTWLAKLATRRLPLEAIQTLRSQTRKSQGWYAERIKGWQALYEKMRREREKAAAGGGR